jgi:hypothetical protein
LWRCRARARHPSSCWVSGVGSAGVCVCECV